MLNLCVLSVVFTLCLKTNQAKKSILSHYKYVQNHKILVKSCLHPNHHLINILNRILFHRIQLTFEDNTLHFIFNLIDFLPVPTGVLGRIILPSPTTHYFLITYSSLIRFIQRLSFLTVIART